jgi:DNA-directed RNA polymerase specialized sigma24 family protein
MATNLDELPARMRKLEEAAFQEFALAFGPRLRRLFLAWGLPTPDAEALAVSCVSDIAVKIDHFSSQGPGSFERWAFTLARAAWVDAWRAREPAGPLLGPEPAAPVAPPGDPGPEVAQAVAEALAQLSETDQAIVRLRHFGAGESFADIARQVQMEEGAARVRHHRALRQLEGLLAAHPSIRAWLRHLRPKDNLAEEKPRD